MTKDLGDLLALYESDAATAMYDEVVTEREHALQAALLAEEAGAPPALVAAALLHDVGRLFVDREQGDRAHDQGGRRYLARWFGPEVTEPVGLHVAAKRYLCATEPEYLHELSAVSVRSLEVQGGPMSEAEVAAFRSVPGSEDAVRLRRWDDAAKREEHPTREVGHYLQLLESLTR